MLLMKMKHSLKFVIVLCEHMTIYNYLSSFLGRPVNSFDSKLGAFPQHTTEASGYQKVGLISYSQRVENFIDNND